MERDWYATCDHVSQRDTISAFRVCQPHSFARPTSKHVKPVVRSPCSMSFSETSHQMCHMDYMQKYAWKYGCVQTHPYAYIRHKRGILLIKTDHPLTQGSEMPQDLVRIWMMTPKWNQDDLTSLNQPTNINDLHNLLSSLEKQANK